MANLPNRVLILLYIENVAENFTHNYSNCVSNFKSFLSWITLDPVFLCEVINNMLAYCEIKLHMTLRVFFWLYKVVLISFN